MSFLHQGKLIAFPLLKEFNIRKHIWIKRNQVKGNNKSDFSLKKMLFDLLFLYIPFMLYFLDFRKV